MADEIMPKWAREIIRFSSVKPQFMLWGNVYDVYPIEMAGGVTTLRMNDYLKTLLRENGCGLIVGYEPLVGFSLLEGSPELFKKITGETIAPEKPFVCPLNKASDVIGKLIWNDAAYVAVVLGFGSRIPDVAPSEMQEFYYRMFRLAQTASPRLVEEAGPPRFNVVLWVLDKENDLPAWYSLDNPRIKNLAVSKPDFAARKIVVENLSRSLEGFAEMDEPKKAETVSLFVDQTNGLHASEIVSITGLARREKIGFSAIADAIRMYKLGIVENPWARLDPARILNSEQLLEKRVKGQARAIRRASDIMKRAVYNLSGAQYSRYSQRPKGVLFFAGPTGVGKTELAKAVTELVFGTETGYIRFDMSEFAHEHADQRLVGAPPGYVGYDVGGQLTNAVKQNPFSVVLFDEIEKAHPKILDIFLQILDDGRLTSGRGETAYFSESLIIFTSNLGIYETAPDGTKTQRVRPDMTYEEINSSIYGAIEDYFKYRLNRPEILNRIGENIVVFDFIRQDSAARIFERMFKNVIFKLEDSFKIKIEITKEAYGRLSAACCADLSMGGRGIGNRLEDAFINPLSRELFAAHASEGDDFVVKDALENEGVWQLVIRKR